MSRSPHQIGQKDKDAFQDADEDEFLAGVIPVDLGSQFPEPGLDLVPGNDRSDDRRHGASFAERLDVL